MSKIPSDHNDKLRMAASVFHLRAQQYADKFMDTSLYHDTFNLFCDQLPQNAAVLDVACGPGNITQYLLAKRPDLKILGIDLAPAMIDLAKTNNPGAELRLMDMSNIRGIGRKFDGIVCGFGLPYLTKEESVQLIADAAAILNENRTLYLSTMEDNYTKSGMQTSSSGDKLFIYYHQADYLVAALRDYGFQLIMEQRFEYSQNDKDYTDLVLIAVKES